MGHVHQFYTTESVRPVLTDAWKFTPRGRAAFVAKLAWRLLHRIGALESFWKDEITVRRVDIDGDRVLRKIMEAQLNCFPSRVRPTRILIGPAELSDAVGDPDAMNLGAITFTGRAGFGPEIFGLPVEVVPHMRGVLVL